MDRQAERLFATHNRLGDESLTDAQALRTWGAASAGLVPVTIEGTTIGALYVDRGAQSSGFDAATLAYLRRIAASASHALALRRGARAAATSTTPAPAAPPLAASDKVELVLRVLRGESMESVIEGRAVTVAELTRWRDEFLAGAMARLAGA